MNKEIKYDKKSVEEAIEETQREYDKSIMERKEKLSPEEFKKFLVLQAIKKLKFCLTDLERDILLCDDIEELEEINARLDLSVNRIVRERYEKQS